MSDFLLKLFKVETINKLPIDKLYPIIENLDDYQRTLISSSYKIDISKLNEEEQNKVLYEKILSEFEKTLMNFDEKEHKSFYDFYNGAVDYSDENVYVNMKKFTALGIMYLFLSKSGTYFNFVIPTELIEKYEELLKSS
ncbi:MULTISPECIES: hypothetical protein [Peptoniphilus]|jgi:hypothetical protein|uniref:hypothetical protein n=1 Tax=Peptoniphilus TaxID=162289 RepID=UPI0008DA5915|nr:MULTISPECIES: hypothetical protein [Peptoniphilus]MBS6610801.1 hypothetical protein [Peptoniphilus harei]MDU1043183.1 hypothetical protein [Peptoniphilus rhinitidis]MDU1954922.1 hypothetical protein [Peptoniphilus lacydonensis]MDU2110330.1 hypothetical protein [Peptoniphilus lacydonensis]MDU3750352.1 hypothetical protein [Peptoniphilus rhinitidis]